MRQCINVSTEYRRLTDGHTDRQTSCDGIVRAKIKLKILFLFIYLFHFSCIHMSTIAADVLPATALFCLLVYVTAVIATKKEAIHDNGGRIRRHNGGRNGTEQVRWHGGNTTDSIDDGTAGSDTCAVPEWGYSTWIRRDNLLTDHHKRIFSNWITTKTKRISLSDSACLMTRPIRYFHSSTLFASANDKHTLILIFSSFVNTIKRALHIAVIIFCAISFFSFLFGVTHAPFAFQRRGLPHRLAQCATPLPQGRD